MFEFLLLVGLIAGLIQFYYLLAWWGNGCLKPYEAILLFGLDGLLLLVLIQPDQPPGIKLLVILLLFAPYIWMYLMFSPRPGELKEMYLEDIEKYRQAIQYDPRNLGAREYLAKTLYQMGDRETALEEMRTLVQMSPESDDLKYRLKQWEEEKRETETGLVVCPKCGHENQRGRYWCRKCETPLVSSQPDSWFQRAGVTGLLMLFGFFTMAVVCFVFLPTALAMLFVFCMLVAIGGWMVKRG